MSLTEVQEAFYELMFGYGRFFGLLFFLVIVLVVSQKLKRGSILFLPVMLLLAMEYNANVSTSIDFYWSIIILFFGAVYVVYNALNE